jgi:hypothetical protein
LATRVAWVRDLFERIEVDSRDEKAVAVWKAATDEGVGRSDSVYEWLRRPGCVQPDFDHIDEVVDLEGYTEICLGLTGWTTGYDAAFRKYIKNMIDPWSEQETSEEEVLETGSASSSPSAS